LIAVADKEKGRVKKTRPDIRPEDPAKHRNSPEHQTDMNVGATNSHILHRGLYQAQSAGTYGESSYGRKINQ
jgi:hypothetical protein